MKKIGIDARLYSQKGVGTYLKNFIHELVRISNKEFTYYIYVLPQDKEKLGSLPTNFIVKDAPFKWHTFGEQIGFLHLLYQDCLDLMHFTYFSYPILYKRKFVATVHDLTPLLFRTGKASTKNPLIYMIKQAVFVFVLKSQIKHASFIITPTNSVKVQLTERFGQDIGRKTDFFYEGVGYELMATRENDSLKRNFPKPFFIYVGNFYPHKNIERLLQAFAQIKTDHQLVLVGPHDFFSQSVLQYIDKLDMCSRIILFEKATPADLVFFYKNALALLHPSLSEGFGLPLIEAAQFKLPIIASNIPVFEELFEDNYVSFDPYSIEDIKAKITTFIQRSKKATGTTLSQKYSFKTMTINTLSVYKDVLEK